MLVSEPMMYSRAREASITNNTYKNMLNSNVVGYIYDDIYGNKAFKTIQDTYYDLIDRATLNVIQGKETFDTELKNTLKLSIINKNVETNFHIFIYFFILFLWYQV